nr:hypothetical protein CFP56_03711 [Quercus suber]
MAATINVTLSAIARLLNAELVGGIPSSTRILVPTGTLGANVWRPGDPVDLICLSENTAATFWAVVEEAFELPPFKIPKDASVTFNYIDIRPVFGTSEITIRYCPFHPEVNDQTPRWDGIYGFSARRTSAEERNRLMGLDTVEMNILEKLPDPVQAREVFRATFSSLHAWFLANGLLHRPSGSLDSEGLLCLLYTALVTYNSVDATDKPLLDVTRLLECFIQGAITTFSSGGRLKSPKGRLLLSHVTSSAAEAIQDALTSLRQSMSNLDTAFKISLEQAYHSFIRQASLDFRLYSLTTESYSIKTSELYHFIDDLPSTLVKYLETRSELQYRIWPHPLVRRDPSNGHGIYTTHIVAIKHRHNPDLLETTSLPTQAEDFLMQRAPAGVTYTLTPVESSESLLIDACIPQPLPTFDLATLKSPAYTRAAPHHDPARPFRPAGKALSRALHDPTHQHTDFEVGYHDRFDGLLWIALPQWGHKATEDEDFIPEHRVLKLRRVEDRVVVWDREERKDWL